jgi:hypothetical protein
MSETGRVQELLGNLWAQVATGGFLVTGISTLFALQASSVAAAAGIVAAALAVGAASAMSGAITGFLFGIPRALALDHQRETANGSLYAPNTNLEQISDWITKILVGLGLVQIGRLPGALNSLSGTLSPPFGGFPSSGSFGVALCVATAALGFVAGYLLARVRLPGLLSQADRLGREEVRQEVFAALDEQATRNAQLLGLVERQLTDDAKAPTQDELNEAVKKGSTDVLLTVYNRAESQRSATWRTDKAGMSRTIPIFQALINNDPGHRFVKHFASLGFAMKDKDDPDFARSVEMLSAAIEVAERQGYTSPLLNWNRAHARILGDPAFRVSPRRTTEEPTRQLILQDLDTAREQELPERFFQESDIVAWRQVNGV